MLNRSASLAMSTSVLKALPGKLDIKRHSPSILYIFSIPGEDRWLCTLLLQQGHRVEYCAASDALTYAPEGFFEFFNQRRRWTPSTMANIMDLLTDWKNVTSRNPEISFMYVFYQVWISFQTSFAIMSLSRTSYLYQIHI